MGLGAVVEPEDAARPFAAADEFEVGVGEEIRGGFGERGEESFGRGGIVAAFDGEGGAGADELLVASAFGEEAVERGRIDAAAGFTRDNQRAKDLAQGAGGGKERAAAEFRGHPCVEQAGARQPAQDVVVTLPGVDEASIGAYDGVEQVEGWMVGDKRGFGHGMAGEICTEILFVFLSLSEEWFYLNSVTL